MNENTYRWLSKAEGDYQSIILLANDQLADHFDNICFLAQQSVEKFLKAILIEQGSDYPRTHDLQQLLDLVVEEHSELEEFRYRFTRLTRLSAAVRYPYEDAGDAEAEFALQTCISARRVLRNIFHLKPDDPT